MLGRTMRRWPWLRTLCIVVGLTGVATAASACDRDEPATTAAAAETEGNLGMTVVEFQETWNRLVLEGGRPELLMIEVAVLRGEERDAFRAILTPNIGIAGTVDREDGLIDQVVLVGGGDVDEAAARDIVHSWGLLIGTTNPDLPVEEWVAVIGDLGFLDENVDIETLDEETVRNGVRYNLRMVDEVGIIFSATGVVDGGEG